MILTEEFGFSNSCGKFIDGLTVTGKDSYMLEHSVVFVSIGTQLSNDIILTSTIGRRFFLAILER